MKYILSVTDCGARADGTAQTKAIQAAIDRCFSAGGGEVAVPEGIFVTGGLRLRSNVTLHLLEHAVLLGTRNPEDYYGYRCDALEPLPAAEITDAPWCAAELQKESGARNRAYRYLRTAGSRWNNSLIRAIHADHIAVVGEPGSVIDGYNCFDAAGEEDYRGPHAISFHDCRNIRLCGYTVQNSGNWAHNLFSCSQIQCESVTVLAGHDGIHMTGCENVQIRDCRFFTGDDCVAGIANTNVWVDSCELNSACSGLRFGGTNVLVTRCHIFGPCRYAFRGSLSPEEKRAGAPSHPEGHRTNMLSAFTYYADHSVLIPSQPENIVLADCIVENADKLLHYNFSGNEMWQSCRPLKNITFENVSASGLRLPSVLYGDAELPVTAEFSDVRFSPAAGCEDGALLWAANFREIVMENTAVSGKKSGPLICTWSEGEIRLQGQNDTGGCPISSRADFAFSVRPI